MSEVPLYSVTWTQAGVWSACKLGQLGESVCDLEHVMEPPS